MPNRRAFIKSTAILGVSGFAGLMGCTSEQKIAQIADQRYQLYLTKLKFPEVQISMDRITKVTVGLRPFRTHGPRIEKEQLGKKVIIHNYGHGGSGWSLSWGTSKMATDLAEATAFREFAVLGCGVMGLTTATLLQQKGYKVKIYTKDLPPNVTSCNATGTWSPSHALIDKEHITDSFVSTWKTACQYSYKRYNYLLGLNEMVEWKDSYKLIPEGFSESRGNGAGQDKFSIPEFRSEEKSIDPSSHPFSAEIVKKKSTMVFNIPAYLQNLQSQFLQMGGSIEIKEIKRVEDVDALPEKGVINCMGLGAKEVFNDEKLIPISGQLVFLRPEPLVDYMLMTPEAYWIPRNDGLVLGGTHGRGNWSLEPDSEATERMVSSMKKVADEMYT